MSDDFKKMIDGIYGWSINNGKVVPPVHRFPKEVKERIDYFGGMAEDGLTFMGAMECIFAEEKPSSYDLGATKDWLPRSEAFNNWANKFPGSAQLEVAVYMIYGNYQEVADDTEV